MKSRKHLSRNALSPSRGGVSRIAKLGRYRAGAAVGVVLLAAGLAGCSEPGAKAGATTNSTAETLPAATQPTFVCVAVERATLRRTAPAVGTLRARQVTRLGPQVSGRVSEVLVDVGDRVARGEVLVRLDPAFFALEVEQNRAAADAARGALGAAEVLVETARREKERQAGLIASGAGSTKEHDDAVSAYDRAVADRTERAAKLAEAVKKLEWAQQRLVETEIRAPYDGAITARLVDPGEPATSAPVTHLLEIQEVGTLYLEFALPQELLGSVAAGTPLTFEVEGVPDGAGAGTVAVVFPAIDEATRSFRCRAILENSAHKYYPGLLARVRVVTAVRPDVLVVPRTALTPAAEGWTAHVLEDGRPVARAVTIGLVADDRVEVLGGLAEGERVVLGGRS